VGPHVLAYLGPDREQGALALVVAGTAGVRFAEVPYRDRAVHRGHDLAERQLVWCPGEHVTAADASFRPDQARPLQRKEDLLEVRLGEPGPVGYVPHRSGLVAAVEGQGQQRPASVVATRRNPHTPYGTWLAPWSTLRPVPLPPPLLMPDYGGACLDGLVPGLLKPPGERPSWFPPSLQSAAQVALVVLDGLGWDQLQERREVAPVLSALRGRAITSVAPTTTATALCSITLGATPAAHGIFGYKFAVAAPTGPEVLNVLKWSTPSGDARRFFPPAVAQPRPAFCGAAVPVVTRSDLAGSGFSEAHQRGAVVEGWVVPSSLPPLVGRLLGRGEGFVYAYYDGIDKVAHATGLGELYEAELRATDRMVEEMLARLPAGAVLAVTADHGQVEVGGRAVPLLSRVAASAELLSGEARFRWLHSRPGHTAALAQQAKSAYGGEAWVATREEALASGVFGGPISGEAADRLGDVLLVPLGEQAYLDEADSGEKKLVCRHGGLSRAEVLVPLVCGPG
jgi:hypothetical protein